MKKFEMAHADKPEEIIMAAQSAIIECMRDTFKSMKADMKYPGLTWDQIDHALLLFKEKKPEIYFQDYEG